MFLFVCNKIHDSNMKALIFFHIQTHATDCRGQLITKTKTPEGLMCTRQAKLSIHEAHHSTELKTLNENEQE